ncbi:dihydroneopterin aldolase [Novosphingobium sediminis]|uniref:Dihydroneopterin aldolase n=1 Tax=Novosphingobium sediminis TaxID=707214 RepID=A0A512AKF3_9SPHN|nr:disulfide bond formation protein B [Novosphingobium sediminis]GEO00199.1 dihydroneopterin aldolase [Novosphingobium sediminis]
MVKSVNTAAQGAYLLALAVPGALIAAVYVAQYGFGLAPCDMCWWQRYPHFAAIALALGGLATRGTRLGNALVMLAALAIGISGVIGAFHAGVEYGWWQGPTACSSTSLGSDPLASIMNAPLIRCDTPAWTLFGISLAGFNFLISVSSAALILLLLGRRSKGLGR